MPCPKLSCLLFLFFFRAHMARFLINLYFGRQKSLMIFRPNRRVWFWSISSSAFVNVIWEWLANFCCICVLAGAFCECLLPLFLFPFGCVMLYLFRSVFFFVLQTTVSSAFFVHFAVSACNITLNLTKYLNFVCVFFFVALCVCLCLCLYVCVFGW